MKRLATLVVAASFALVAVMSMGRAVFATPFSDVPANHWAYQYIQSLAADGVIDGYPDGKFKGDRPMTRYEMAVVVARAVAKLQENQSGVSKQDLDKLQKLIDALKDELDALGVRVTNLEDALDALDKRTKFAQALSMHGALNNRVFAARPAHHRPVGGERHRAVRHDLLRPDDRQRRHRLDRPVRPGLPGFERLEQPVDPGRCEPVPALRRQVHAALPDQRQPRDHVPRAIAELRLRRCVRPGRCSGHRARRRRVDRPRGSDHESARQVRRDRRHEVVADRADLQGPDRRHGPALPRTAAALSEGHQHLGYAERADRLLRIVHARCADRTQHANLHSRPQRERDLQRLPLPDDAAAGRLHPAARLGLGAVGVL